MEEYKGVAYNRHQLLQHIGDALQPGQVMILGLLIVMISSIAQGITGFGFALLAVPLLSLIMPFGQVVPIVVGLSLFSNLVMILKLYQHVELKKIWLLIVFGFIGIPIGGYILLVIEAVILKVLVGLFIFVFAILLLRKITFPIRNEYLAFPIVGILSGLLNGSISASGPPLVLFLTNQGKDQQVFKANLAFYGVFLNISTMVVFFMNGTLSRDVIELIVQLLVIMIVGTVIGMVVAKKIDKDMFRKLVIYLLLVSSVWMILGAIVF